MIPALHVGHEDSTRSQTQQTADPSLRAAHSTSAVFGMRDVLAAEPASDIRRDDGNARWLDVQHVLGDGIPYRVRLSAVAYSVHRSVAASNRRLGARLQRSWHSRGTWVVISTTVARQTRSRRLPIPASWKTAAHADRSWRFRASRSAGTSNTGVRSSKVTAMASAPSSAASRVRATSTYGSPTYDLAPPGVAAADNLRIADEARALSFPAATSHGIPPSASADIVAVARDDIRQARAADTSSVAIRPAAIGLAGTPHATAGISHRHKVAATNQPLILKPPLPLPDLRSRFLGPDALVCRLLHAPRANLSPAGQSSAGRRPWAIRCQGPSPLRPDRCASRFRYRARPCR